MDTVYIQLYHSFLGEILLAADEQGLRGLWFEGQKDYGGGLPSNGIEKATPILEQAVEWLDVFFSGREPDFLPPLHPVGTDFQREVWALLETIPYGQTSTYGALAKALPQSRGTPMSPQAVGGAVGRNPISLLIPCHRVIGAQGQLTGYAGGIERKHWLLALEGVHL